MSKSEFDDEFLRLVEEFNTSAGAIERRSKILAALDLRPGYHVLDIGSGPGHMVAEISPHVRPGGSVKGVDSAESAVTLARQRLTSFDNVEFVQGDAYRLPFENSSFDVVMSSQVFEYLDNVVAALSEIFRVLKPGGRVLMHGTEWEIANPRYQAGPVYANREFDLFQEWVYKTGCHMNATDDNGDFILNPFGVNGFWNTADIQRISCEMAPWANTVQ